MEQPTCPTCGTTVTFPLRVEAGRRSASMTLQCLYGHEFTLTIERKAATS